MSSLTFNKEYVNTFFIFFLNLYKLLTFLYTLAHLFYK
ncbi:Rab5-interacting protein, partial [Listeria ivanovii FSL F6-596]